MTGRRWAWVAGFGGIAVVTVVCSLLGDLIDNTITALLLLIPIAVASVLGGWRRSVVVSFVAALAYALAFLPPIGHVRIGLTRDVFVLVTFEAVAVLVGVLAARREPPDSDVVLRAVSHDLRNPLSTIRAVSTDLLSGVHTDDAARAELLGLVVSESERLDRIVGNLLSVGRVRAGTLVPVTAPVRLDELLTTSTSRLQRADGPPIVLDVAPGIPAIRGDAVQLDQVVANLVENSLRHAPATTSVRVTARVQGDLVVIVVADDGPGFSLQARRDAFEPFRSAHGSTGIGLAVCKSLVAAHGGTIRILEDGAGARVSFTLPI